mgnify:CR=1 FL=1
MDSPLMTTKDVCAYLRVSLVTIYRMIRDKKIPVIRVSGRWRFIKTEIDKWMEAKTCKS